MPPKVRTSTPDVDGELPHVPAEGGRRVGDAGAVEVHLHAVAVRDVDERGDLVGRVERAHLGGLGDRDDPGLHVVDVAEEVGVLVDLLGPELAVGGRARR